METAIQTISNQEGRMTSLMLAELSGKQHKNIMRDIRNMEDAWEKITGLKFELSEYRDTTGRSLPCYISPKPRHCTSPRNGMMNPVPN